MVIKGIINNYIKLFNFDKRSIDNNLKWNRKNYLKKKKNDFFFNFDKMFILNSNYKHYFFLLLKEKKKKYWWRKISFKKRFTDNLKFGELKPIKRSWIYCIRSFPQFRNKYIMYTKYFYTYKFINFKNFTI